MNCRQQVNAKKGFSWVIFLLLLIFGVGIGGLLYVFYWLIIKRKTCPICGARHFGSPAASGDGMGPGEDSFRIPPGEFRYVGVDTVEDAKLWYSVEVLNGPGINVIVTYEKNIDDFRKSPQIGWVEQASAIDVKQVEKEAVLHAADYAVILDNTGRFGGQGATDKADVSISYNLS